MAIMVRDGTSSWDISGYIGIGGISYGVHAQEIHWPRGLCRYNTRAWRHHELGQFIYLHGSVLVDRVHLRTYLIEGRSSQHLVTGYIRHYTQGY